MDVCLKFFSVAISNTILLCAPSAYIMQPINMHEMEEHFSLDLLYMDLK